MRILTKEETKKADINFIYAQGNALAIVEQGFDRKFEIKRREDVE